MRIILKLAVAVLAILLASYLVQGIHVSGVVPAIIASLILGILSITIKPVVKILTLPLTVLTFGLFAFLVNAFFFWITSRLVSGFSIDGFIPAVIGSIVVSAVNYLGDKIIDDNDD